MGGSHVLKRTHGERATDHRRSTRGERLDSASLLPYQSDQSLTFLFLEAPPPLCPLCQGSCRVSEPISQRLLGAGLNDAVEGTEQEVLPHTGPLFSLFTRHDVIDDFADAGLCPHQVGQEQGFELLGAKVRTRCPTLSSRAFWRMRSGEPR